MKIDIREVNQQTVSQTIDAMVKADPQLAWLKEAEARGDVDWRQVKEVHDAFKYSQSGLGAGAQLVIAIVIAYFTAGAASGLVASGASAAGASTAASSAWAAGVGSSLQGIGWANAAATAALTGAAGNAAISTVNNRGNLGAVVSDITSEDALRGYAVSGITAGLTASYFNEWTKTQTGTGNSLQNGVEVLSKGGLGTWSGVGSFAGNQMLQNTTSALIDRALGGNAELGKALQNSLVTTFAAAGFNLVGDITAPDRLNLPDGSLAKIGLHAVMGGLAAEAAGGDFSTGALAAGVNEALVDSLAKHYGDMDPAQKKSLLVMNSQLIGVLAAAAQGKADAESLQTGAQVAGSATQYNYLLHEELLARDRKVAGCGSDDNCRAKILKFYADLDQRRNDGLPGLCKADPDQCMGVMRQLASERGVNAAAVDSLRFEDINAAIGIQIAAESNEVAIDTIQLELIRQKYGEGTALALEMAQIAAAGGVPKHVLSAAGRSGKGSGQQGAGLEAGHGIGDGVPSGAKATASFSEVKTVLESAQAPYKGTTIIGHALSKHAGRNPDIWGKTTGSMSTWNDQAMKHLREIVRAPGEFKPETTDKGLMFMEKRLPDGRGVRLNMNGAFKGFID
ncbi:DUF637 domain-containing protein [Pseudomonas sp. TE21394]